MNWPEQPNPMANNMNFAGLEEVSIDKIIEAARANGPNSNFQKLLSTAKVYKSMGVEPVFLINNTYDAIRVAAKEVWENPKRLN